MTEKKIADIFNRKNTIESKDDRIAGFNYNKGLALPSEHQTFYGS